MNCYGFRLIRREYQRAVPDLGENGWRNDQRSSQFARYRVNGAVLPVDGVTEFLPVDLKDNLYRKIGRIFRETDKLLIIYSEGTKRSWFTKPIRLGIRSVLRDPARQVLRYEFVWWKCRINFHRVAGERTTCFLECDWDIAPVNCLQLYCYRLPWRDGLIGCRRFYMQAETRGDNLIQLGFFLRDPGVILNSAQRLP